MYFVSRERERNHKVTTFRSRDLLSPHPESPAQTRPEPERAKLAKLSAFKSRVGSESVSLCHIPSRCARAAGSIPPPALIISGLAAVFRLAKGRPPSISPNRFSKKNGLRQCCCCCCCRQEQLFSSGHCRLVMTPRRVGESLSTHMT